MLELGRIRSEPDQVLQALALRGHDRETAAAVVEKVLTRDCEHRALLTRQQELRTAIKLASRAIGQQVREGDAAGSSVLKQAASLRRQAHALGKKREEAAANLHEALLAIPNVPHISVPAGQAADANVVVHTAGDRPEFGFQPLPHWTLAERLQIVDFWRGAKVTGAGFPFYVGEGARLQRALIHFFLEEARQAGYTEIQPPLMVNEASARGTGQLPDKEGQMYVVEDPALLMIPTAEVPLTNYYRDEILPAASLPVKVCGSTPCWRREAGSYGKDVRGLNRLHQFDKVEIVQITRPQQSYTALEEMVQHAERLLEKLQLPYRRLLMCTGEMGFNQSKQYDLEVFSAGQRRWLEVSSVSNFESFQSNRLKLRYRPMQGGKPALAHTLNGSALALPRIVAALLENHQRVDGSIALPAALSASAGANEAWIIGDAR